MGNRPQRTLHADEMFTSESHRSVRTIAKRSEKEIDKLTVLLDAVPQHVPHVAVIPPEGDAAEGGIPRVVV